MQNEAGDNVDLYIPRKCSWTNRLIRAKDHTSVQINVANMDPVTGLATNGSFTPYALAGYVRFKSESDMALTTLVQQSDVTMWNLNNTSGSGSNDNDGAGATGGGAAGAAVAME